MAEVFLFTRGNIDCVERWERSMRSLEFPYKFKKKVKDEQGKEMEVETTQSYQGQLRPYQLWGYVCPEEFVQPLCNSLGIPTNETYLDKKPGEQTGSFITGKGIGMHLAAMRLAMGAKKLPKPDMTKGVLNQPIFRDNMNVLGIGWRPDISGKDALGEHELI